MQIFILIVMSAYISMTTTLIVKDMEKPETKTVYLNGTIESDEEFIDVQEYHESDDLVKSTKDSLIYVNKTSPDADTLYLYSISNLKNIK